MKVGILGGTFDPIHKGHIALAKAALKQKKLHRVYLVLSPRSPFKLNHTLTPVDLRLQMLEAALKGEKQLKVGDWELNRRGPSYTVKTLADYKKKNPKDQLYLIMGSDALTGFNQWKDPVKILKMASLIVAPRPGATITLGDVNASISFLSGAFPDISSTLIRHSIRKGISPNLYLAPSTLYLVRKHRLYED